MKEFFGMPWLPVNASAHGDQLDDLNIYVHWVMLFLFVGWGIFFIYTLIRFRKSRNAKARYDGVTSHQNTYLEIGVALVEVVLLLGFSIPLWAKFATEYPAEKDSVVMRVVAEQFAWRFHYPGPDSKFGNTIPELVDDENNPLGIDRENDPNAKDDVVSQKMNLIVNKPVIVHLSSKDVIHNLGIPAFRVKQDAIPGNSIPVSFTPITLGKYLIACSQLCGIGHASMQGYIDVLTQDQFEAWMEEELEEILSDSDAF